MLLVAACCCRWGLVEGVVWPVHQRVLAEHRSHLKFYADDGCLIYPFARSKAFSGGGVEVRGLVCLASLM
jgi:hypothetical protein